MGNHATKAASMGGRANTSDVDALVSSYGGDRVQLGALGLSPLTATATVAWTGTLSNRLAGSTVTATSSDGTTLTVNQGANTVGGTFATTGSKTITLTETAAGALGSPLVTTKTVVVS